MLMNASAHIARNPMAQCAYFLSLIDRPKVKGWVEQMYNWLDTVDQIPGMIPPGQNAWQVLEGRFKSAFVDYAEDVHAQEELKKLKMKEGNVDEYVATFELLGQYAQGDLNNPFLLTHFACGLPKALVDVCINNESPETFQEWKAAALHQQKNWMRKQALHREQTPACPQGQSQGFHGWTWNRLDKDKDRAKTGGPIKGIALLCLILVFPLEMMIEWTCLLRSARRQRTKKSKSTTLQDDALNAEGRDISLVTVPIKRGPLLTLSRFKKAVI